MSTQPLIQKVPGDLSSGVKWPGREADHSPPSSAEVKECVELYLHSTNTPSWLGAQLKHRGNISRLLNTAMILCDVLNICNSFNQGLWVIMTIVVMNYELYVAVILNPLWDHAPPPPQLILCFNIVSAHLISFSECPSFLATQYKKSHRHCKLKTALSWCMVRLV
jgi:hypothetical protein